MSIANIGTYQYTSPLVFRTENASGAQSVEKTLIIRNSTFNLSKEDAAVINETSKNQGGKGHVTRPNSEKKQNAIEHLGHVINKPTEIINQSIPAENPIPEYASLSDKTHVEIQKNTVDIILSQLSKRFKYDLPTIRSCYSSSKYDWVNKKESSLSWWLDNKWKGTNTDIGPFLVSHEENNVLSFDNKKYLFIKPYYWEVIEDVRNSTFFVKNKNGEKIKIQHDNNTWCLGEWEQQKLYIYAKKDILQKIDNESISVVDKLLQLIFHRYPSETISNALQYASDELLILIAGNLEDKILCNDLLRIKKMISLSTNNKSETAINDDEIRILNALSIPIDLEAIKKIIFELYPSEINTEKYIENIHNYYTVCPSPEEVTKVDNLSFIKGIAYTEGVMHAHSDLSPIKIFWQTIFSITKSELLIKQKKTISASDREQLTYLNVAKYHAFTLSKYIDVYTSTLKIINEMKVKRADVSDGNNFNAIKESKKLALPIYYKMHENIDIDTLNLNDSQLIIEHDRIANLDNKISDILKNITSIIFYKLNYPYEISIFDFIKARVFHEQKITATIENIYAFDDVEPEGYISSSTFKTSTECNSQSAFTSQFNSYIDNGSSEYESKLLTPLFLSQLNIYPEILSCQSMRWFSLELTIEETKTSGLRWPIRTYKVQKEKINIIKLKNSDYIIISALKGKLEVTSVKGVIYEELLDDVKKTGISDYVPWTEKNLITELLVGDDFESDNIDVRYRLTIDREYDNPSLVKETMQKSIHSCLNEIAKYKKSQLDIKGVFQEITEAFIPFYREFYYKMTDKYYKVDKLSIIMDAVFMGSSLSQLSSPLKQITHKVLSGINHLYLVGKERKLSRARLSEFIAKASTKNKVINECIPLDNSLVSIVSPLSYREISNSTIKHKGNIVRIEDDVYDIVSQYKETNVQLEHCSQQGRFKGLYRSISEHELSSPKYYIKNHNDIYKVNWDANLYTWRIIEKDNPVGLSYGPAIKYVSENKWQYNDNIGLLGGGLETDNIIDSISDINTEVASISQTSRTVPENSSHIRDNSLFNKEQLRNTKSLKRINKNLVTAQKKAIKKIKAAKRIIANDKYSSRVHELLKIFTNRQNDQSFSALLNGIEEALINTKLQENTLFVIDDASNLLAQTALHTQNNGKHIAINYAAYKKSINEISSGKVAVSQTEKSKLAKENLARTIVHEFSHIIGNTTDTAGYIELLHLDGKHDITKLLIKSKLELPEVYNNADAITEVIIILSKANNDESYLNDFLEHYKLWESVMDDHIKELTPVVQKTVEKSTGLSWNTTVKMQIAQLNEAFNVEMSKCLISEIDEDKKIFFDLNEPLNEYASK